MKKNKCPTLRLLHIFQKWQTKFLSGRQKNTCLPLWKTLHLLHIFQKWQIKFRRKSDLCLQRPHQCTLSVIEACCVLLLGVVPPSGPVDGHLTLLVQQTLSCRQCGTPYCRGIVIDPLHHWTVIPWKQRNSVSPGKRWSGLLLYREDGTEGRKDEPGRGVQKTNGGSDGERDEDEART